MNDIEETQGASGKAITSMVLGILSIPAGCMGLLSLVLAVPGLILGLMSRNSNSRGFAITGIVTSVVGMLTGIIVTLLALFFIPLRVLDADGHEHIPSPVSDTESVEEEVEEEEER